MSIIQKPNKVLIVAVAASLLAIIFRGGWDYRLFASLALVAWSGWGYDELCYGDSIARRIFGASALLAVFLSAWIWY